MMYLKNCRTTDRLLRVHTAARMLGCSSRTVRRRIQNHELPATLDLRSCVALTLGVADHVLRLTGPTATSSSLKKYG
jgi:predicted DNA-binding transcriptional regulator AlpA